MRAPRARRPNLSRTPARPATLVTVGSSALNAARRSRDLEWLADGGVVDVLVIGGGITGAGVALDAATRGLSVALIERRDLANGTSRWSSKLAHGGLRYLAQGQPGIAWESARERAVLIDRTAPHLVRPFPGVLPLTAGVPRRMEAGIALVLRGGDAMRAASGTSGRVLPPMRRISTEEARRLVPALRDVAMRGALLSWDGQLEDDARLVVTVARTAAGHGARIVTYAEAIGIHPDGADVRDGRTGETLRIRARHVVNAAGVWAGTLAPGVTLRPSRGTHLLLAPETLGHPRSALTIPIDERATRFAGAIPRPDGLLQVGLTDDPADGEVPDEPAVPDADRDFLLSVLGSAIGRTLTPADVVGAFTGFRPLLDGEGDGTSDLSRRHAVLEDPETGMLTIVGGKLTTYRRMAQDTVDRLAARPGVAAGPCVTARLPLVGAQRRDTPTPSGVPERLVRRYGAEASDVAAYAEGDRELMEPIGPGLDTSVAELRFAVAQELALTPEDLVDRRSRVGLVPAHRAAALPFAEAALAGRAATAA